MQRAIEAFEAGDYDTALRGFEQARAQGVDTAFLDFNLGVTYYRLQRLDEAQVTFERITEDPKLGGLASYNLGLVMRAQGKLALARHWFEQTARIASEPKLRALARTARRRLGEAVKVDERRSTTDSTSWLFSARAGLAYDDNVFRTPDSPYFDLAPSSPTLVIPDVQNGFFVPLWLVGRLTYRESVRASLVGSFLLNGDYYVDSALDNGNRFRSVIRIGERWLLGGKNPRSEQLYGGIVLVRSERTNYDRDTGRERIVRGQKIGDRYSYTASGFELRWAKRAGDFQYGLEASLSRRNYENETVTFEFDHLYYEVGGELKYYMNQATRLTATYHFSREDYDERPARDELGDLRSTNPELNYDFHELELELKRRLGTDWRFYARYVRTERGDDFVNYDDFSKDEFELELRWDNGNRLEADCIVQYWDRDYDKAFAFSNPAAGSLEFDGWEAKLRAEYALGRHLRMRGELQFTEANSSDARIEYDRTKALISLEWNY